MARKRNQRGQQQEREDDIIMTNYIKTFPREDLEQGVLHLAQKYPAAFFPGQYNRRPLSLSILDHLQEEGESELLLSSANFYMRSWFYQRALQAGAERVDLNGKKAGVVTKKEELAAQKQIEEEKAAHARKQQEEQQQFRTLPLLQPTTTKSVAKPILSNSKLARLHTLLGAAAEVKTDDEPLQAAMTTAALKLLVVEAQKVISELEAGAAVEE
jgi:sRNA-binding protein